MVVKSALRDTTTGRMSATPAESPYEYHGHTPRHRRVYLVRNGERSPSK